MCLSALRRVESIYLHALLPFPCRLGKPFFSWKRNEAILKSVNWNSI